MQRPPAHPRVKRDNAAGEPKCSCNARALLQRHLQPEQDHAGCDHAEVVGGALLVAGGDAAELLEAIDQALHPATPPIGGAVEGGLAALVALAGDPRSDVPAPQMASDGRAAVALVAGRAP